MVKLILSIRENAWILPKNLFELKHFVGTWFPGSPRICHPVYYIELVIFIFFISWLCWGGLYYVLFPIWLLSSITLLIMTYLDFSFLEFPWFKVVFLYRRVTIFGPLNIQGVFIFGYVYCLQLIIKIENLFLLFTRQNRQMQVRRVMLLKYCVLSDILIMCSITWHLTYDTLVWHIPTPTKMFKTLFEPH